MQTVEQFWSNVIKMPDGCWLWCAGTNEDGYGKVNWRGKTVYVHRLGWELRTGKKIPRGKYVLHCCPAFERRCILHTYLGTQKDNVRDTELDGHTARGERHGSALHPEAVARGDRHRSRTHPETIARGNDHWTRLHPEWHIRKLSSKTVEHIRKLWRYSRDSLTQKKLAERYGVSQTRISQIVRG